MAYNLVEYYANKNQHIAKRICIIRARLGAKFLFPVFVHGRVINIPLDEKDKNVKAYREISALKCFQYEQISYIVAKNILNLFLSTSYFINTVVY